MTGKILWLMLVMFFVAVASSYAISTTNLIHYYKFNGDSTDYIGALDGSDTNIQYNIGDDFLGESAYCNGTGYINIGALDDEIGNAQSFTTVIWVKHNDSADADSELMGYYDGTGVRFDMRVNPSGAIANLLSLGIDDGTTYQSNGGTEGTAKNDWIMYSATYNKTGQQLELYLNATRVDSDSYDIGDWRKALDWYLCKRGGISSNPFNGQIDEFSVWNVALQQNNISELYNGGSGLELTGTNFTLTAYNRINNTVINSFSADVNGTIYSTTIGTLTTGIPQTNDGKVNITFSRSGYLNITYYNITAYGNFRGNLTPATILNITFRSEIDQSIVTDFTTLEAFNTELGYSFNSSTTTGSMQFLVITPANYTLRYDSQPNWTRKFYELEVTGIYNRSLTLYHSNSTITSDITITIYDSSLNTIAGAVLEVYRFNPASNGYFITEILTTDVNGVAVAHLILNEEFYKFRVLINGEEKYYSDRQIITSTTIDIYGINIIGQIGETVKQFDDITYNLNFTNSSQLVYFSWNDPNSIITQACLDIYKVTGLGRILVNTSCVSSAGGSITLGGVNQSTGQYDALGVYDTSSTTNNLLAKISFGDVRLVSGKAGLFYYIIIQLAFLFIFRWSLGAGLIAFPLPFLGACIMGILAISYTWGVAMTLIGLILGVLVIKN